MVNNTTCGLQLGRLAGRPRRRAMKCLTPVQFAPQHAENRTRGGLMRGIVDRALLGASIALCFYAQHAAADSASCAALATRSLSIIDQDADPHGDADRGKGGPHRLTPTITAATLKPAAGTIPEYCRVEGYLITGDE